MKLPVSSRNEKTPPVPVLPTPVILGVSDSSKVNKILVDNAIAQKTVETLPELFERLKGIALESESENTALDALKYMIDRAAGKTADVTRVTGTVTHIHISEEEVRERLAHLNAI